MECFEWKENTKKTFEYDLVFALCGVYGSKELGLSLKKKN